MSGRTLWAVAALTALGAALRFFTLDVQSFWLDEAVTVEVVRGSLADTLDRVAQTESTPYLYYVLAWPWSAIFGDGEIGVRSFSALIGTATIPVVYVAGARLVDRRSGIATAAIIAVSPLAVHYSQEARAYALLILLAAASFVGFASLYRGPVRPAAGAVVFWSVACCLALLTHYFAVFLIAAEAIFLAFGRASLRRAVALGLIPVGVTGVLLLPLAVEQRSHGFADWIGEDPILTRAAQVVKQFFVGLDGPVERLTTVVAFAIVVVGLLALVREGDRRRREGALIAAGVGATTVLVPLVLAFAVTDYFNARNVVASLVPFAVFVGVGIASYRRLGPVLLAAYGVLSMAIVVAVAVDVRYQRDDWRGVARSLGEADVVRVIVVAPDVGRVPLAYYLPETTPLLRGQAAVVDVVFVGMGEKTPGGGASAPVPTTTEPPLPGLQLEEEMRSKTYTILRYRSSDRVIVEPAIAAKSPFPDASRSVLVQLP